MAKSGRFGRRGGGFLNGERTPGFLLRLDFRKGVRLGSEAIVSFWS